MALAHNSRGDFYRSAHGKIILRPWCLFNFLWIPTLMSITKKNVQVKVYSFTCPHWLYTTTRIKHTIDCCKFKKNNKCWFQYIYIYIYIHIYCIQRICYFPIILYVILCYLSATRGKSKKKIYIKICLFMYFMYLYKKVWLALKHADFERFPLNRDRG